MAKELKKIVIIGPVYPFKGGISHYTSLMYQNLAKKYDVEAVSFTVQYPKILYKKQQKDFENDLLKISGAKYWLHTVNPFNWISTAKKIRKLNPDLILIQWWHPYFSPCYWVLLKLLRKFKRLILCNNVFPHARFSGDRFLTKAVLKQGDAYIVHSEKDQKDLDTIISDAVSDFALLPGFGVFRSGNVDKAEARKQLGLQDDENVILFFGFVQKYKGLDYLLNALPLAIQKTQRLKLLIVGEFGGDQDQYLRMIEDNGIREHIDLYAEYVPDREIEKYFMAADVVILPYESATSSGIVQMAYAFDKPIIATDVGVLPNVVVDNETGYIVEHKNIESIADGITRFFEQDRSDEFKAGIQRQAYRFSWDRMTEKIEGLWDRMQ